jgi:NAD(P)-dependent dehydrogenase (short-subunit alcohol dehydrogenase family)
MTRTCDRTVANDNRTHRQARSSRETLDALSAELGATTLSADLADPLIANAALTGVGRLTDFSVDDLDRNLAVNLRAPIVMARAVAPAMLERGSVVRAIRRNVGEIVAAPVEMRIAANSGRSPPRSTRPSSEWRAADISAAHRGTP